MTTNTWTVLVLLAALFAPTVVGLSIVLTQLRKDVRLRRGKPYRQRGDAKALR